MITTLLTGSFNPPAEETIHVWLNGKGKKPYAVDASYYSAATFQSAVLDHLLHTNLAFDLQPGLINSWYWDFKNHYYILELRKDLQFHNGRRATAKDLEFSILRGFFSSRPQFFTSLLSNVEGIDKLKEGKQKFKPGLVSGVEVVDDQHLRIRLRYPNPSFLHTLSESYFSLVPSEELKEDYLTWKNLPVGAGPYKVVESDPSASGVLLQRVSEEGKSPKYIYLTTDDASRATADLVIWPRRDFSGTHLKKALAKLDDSLTTLMFNFKNELGADEKFRRAISLTLRRQELFKDEEGATATTDWLPRTFWGRLERAEVFDPIQAKKLLSELSPKKKGS